MSQQEDNFAQRLRELRKASGLSGEKLAAKIGLQGTSIVLMEKGERKPSFDALRKLAVALGVSADYLLCLPTPTRPLKRSAPPKWVAELMPDLAALDKPGREAVRALVNGLKKIDKNAFKK